jgi:hypothetical protein
MKAYRISVPTAVSQKIARKRCAATRSPVNAKIANRIAGVR